MRNIVLIAILGCTLAIASHTPAQAQLVHTWVASNGSDGANCDRPTPCATFGGAYGKTNVGGEISCVDGGNYGGATISKSLTINCEAATGSNTVSGGGSIAHTNVSGLAATDVVILRGLDLDGTGLTSGSGLVIFQGPGTLRLEKMRISSLHGTADGVSFLPSGISKLHVSESHITNNATSGINAGINIRPTSGAQATVEIERTVVSNNQFGIFLDGTAGGTIRGLVTDSIVSGNTSNGISVNTAGTIVGLMVENTRVSGNNIGLAAGGAGGLILVRRSTITANSTGLSAGGGGILVTYKDNTLNNNTTDGAFSFAIGTQ